MLEWTILKNLILRFCRINQENCLVNSQDDLNGPGERIGRRY